MDRSTGLGEDDRGGISSGQTSTAQHSVGQETGGDVMAPAPASSAPVPVPTPTDRPAIAPRRPRVRLLALNISAVTQRSNGMYEPRVRMRVSAGRSITYQWRAPFFRHTEPPPCIYIYHDTSTDRKQPAVAAPRHTRFTHPTRTQPCLARLLVDRQHQTLLAALRGCCVLCSLYCSWVSQPA